MPSLNKVMLIGHAGKDCELRYLTNGTPQGKFSLATSESFRKGDDWEERTEWHNVVIWGDLAERIAQYIVKGVPVFVEGKIQSRNWTDDQGQKHYMTEINASTVQTLSPREKGNTQPSRSTSTPNRRAAATQKAQPEELPWE